jgi:hypothetical protein
MRRRAPKQDRLILFSTCGSGSLILESGLCVGLIPRAPEFPLRSRRQALSCRHPQAHRGAK